MFDLLRTIPMPGDPCPPFDDPEAVLLWIWQQHLRCGRIKRHGEHRDPLWQWVEEKQAQRHELLAAITTDPDWAKRVDVLARLFKLDLAGLGRDEQIAAVVRACVPLRFQNSTLNCLTVFEAIGKQAQGERLCSCNRFFLVLAYTNAPS